MKTKVLAILILALSTGVCKAQTADASFHIASNQYIHEKNREALTTLESALKKYPGDKKLNALREKIKEDQRKEQQEKQQKEEQQKQKEQQEKEQKEKEQEQKEQQEKDQKEKEEQQKKDQEKKQPQEQQEQEQKEKQDQKKDLKNLDKEKLEQMKISEDKARMLLEAMKAQEKQYLQQNKRKATKSRDRSKPDW
jgi:hypothetical protein